VINNKKASIEALVTKIQNQKLYSPQDGKGIVLKTVLQGHQRTGSAGTISEAPTIHTQTLFNSTFGMSKEYRALAPVFTGARVGTPLKKDH